MKLPKGMTEEEVLATIENVVGRLAPRFVFGYHDVDDMKQEATLFALQGLKYYDNKRPLENFLWVRVRNLLFNFKRDNFKRPYKSCYYCPYNAYNAATSSCSLYDDIFECSLYHNWYVKNSAKQNLMSPIELSQVHDENENNMRTDDDTINTVLGNELMEIIEQNISLKLRADYLRIKNGVRIPKNKQEKVQEAVMEILVKYGYYDENEEGDV